MRVIRSMAPAAVAIAITLTGHAAAQEAGRPVPESIRPQDTRPSIPVETPTIEPRSGAGRAGTAPQRSGDPDAPVSSPQRAGGTTAEPVSGDAGTSGIAPDQTGTGPLGAEPYAAGLPGRAAPPRTLRAHWHVFVAFAIVWILLFGYALSIGRRFGRLEAEVRRLGGPAA